jgi:hypothetical protein
VDEVEAAAEEDHDTDSAGNGECDGGTAHAEETEKNGAIACDGDKEESTPEECHKEVQE